jgi:hypothetical protein
MNKLAKDTAKSHLHKINQKIRSLTRDMRKLANDKNIDRSEDIRTNKIILEREISHLQKKNYRKTSIQAQAQWASHGETISKYWSKVNNPQTPRDIIHRLYIPNTNRYTCKSEEMAEIAKTYHDSIQAADTLQHTEEDRRNAQERSLNEIPENQKLGGYPDAMNEILKEEHILEALTLSKSGSASGMDGIPYNVWKTLHQKHIEAKKNDKPSFNLIKVMTHVLNDIQVHGVLAESSFTIGWMLLRTRIEYANKGNL